jgi:hypothetical protein
MRIILDAIKYPFIPHVSGRKNASEMWESLIKLYQSSNENREMVLREKLINTKITKTDTVSSYLTKITWVKDELAAVGDIIKSTQLVITA